MQKPLEKNSYSCEDLVQIVEMLRSPEGCPWDRAQDHHTIRNNFLEETYEAVEAIDRSDPVLLQEELGIRYASAYPAARTACCCSTA